jgi:hypothetical protein
MADEQPFGLGRVRAVVTRARTATQGVFDIAVGDRGIVLVPLFRSVSNPAAAVVLGAVQGGAIGHWRGRHGDERRREAYLAASADELARHWSSHRTLRPGDLLRFEVKDHHGGGKLRVHLRDGTRLTLRWDRRRCDDAPVAGLLVAALDEPPAAKAA